MILMGLVSVVMIFGMPKLMENSTCFGYRTCDACSTGGFANSLQWMRRQRRNSKRCRLALSVVEEALRMLRARFRTLTWLDSCRGSLVLRRVRRSETACKRRNTTINAKAHIPAIVPSLYLHSSAPGSHVSAASSREDDLPEHFQPGHPSVSARICFNNCQSLSGRIFNIRSFPSAHLA
jgi:hypothetical protein